jgi:oligopeptide/dipeptide ABC transporter ATP-binding protein
MVSVMEESLLEVKGLQLHFDGHKALWRHSQDEQVVRAVDGVDLSIARGEALGLVGESGCGKSTLARCITGLYEPTEGTLFFAGSQLKTKRRPQDRRRIQMVFQDPYSSLNPRMTVRQTVSELLHVHEMVPQRNVRDRCLELMDLVGLGPSVLEAYPRQLSGGQRQRVSIARALALEPELLVADEPVSALDVSVQATILNLLADLRARLGLTLLLITHDMAVVRQVCNRVAVMYLGRIVETAATEVLFGDPRHPYAQGLLAAVPSLVPGRASSAPAVAGDLPSPIHIPVGCRFNPRCPLAQPVCRSEDPALVNGPVPEDHQAACHFAWVEPPHEHTPEVVVETEGA